MLRSLVRSRATTSLLRNRIAQLTACRASTTLSSSGTSGTKHTRNVQTAQRVAEVEPVTEQAQPQFEEFDDAKFVGMKGGEIFEEVLRQLQVKTVFGYPGGAILPVFDGIHDSPHFDLIIPRHEQGAGHMAEGYARVTGKPGVVLVTSGPGGTNTITPMQDALSDGIPIVVFTGQVPTTARGSDAFQECDMVGISRACTKWNASVDNINDLPRIIREAFHIATSGRPGPVLVDLPKDVTASTLKKLVSSTPNLPAFRKRNFLRDRNEDLAKAEAIDRTVALLNKAERPILYVGAGALDAEDEVRAFAEKMNIPVTTTLQGMGVFDEHNDLSMHMLGMHGSAYANFAMQRADLIVAIGARFDDRVTGNLALFAPEAKQASKNGRGGFIHFDIMPKNISKVVPADVAVIGDTKSSLQMLLAKLNDKTHPEWIAECQDKKERFPFNPFASNMVSHTGRLRGPVVIQELNRQLEGRKDEALITTGVGQHQMWAAQYIRWRHPRTFVTSGGLGTMGFGLPSAIGAKVAFPDKIVVDIDGDASFQMSAMELCTAVQFGIKVKVLILNNDFQGMVKQWQDLFYDQRYSGTTMVNPDFVKFAEALNMKGIRASTPEELPEKMKEFLDHDGPVLMEAVCCKEEHVYPMIPAGKGLHEMVFGAPEKAD